MPGQGRPQRVAVAARHGDGEAFAVLGLDELDDGGTTGEVDGNDHAADVTQREAALPDRRRRKTSTPEATAVRARTSRITATRISGDPTSGRGPTRAGSRPSGDEAGSWEARSVDGVEAPFRAAGAESDDELPAGKARACSRSPRAIPARGSTGGADTAMLGTRTRALATGRSTRPTTWSPFWVVCRPTVFPPARTWTSLGELTTLPSRTNVVDP